VRTLVCAATRAEHDACRRGIVASGGFAASAYETLLTGVGPVRAAQALAARLARGELPDLVVSSGFAGALGHELPLATWATGARVREWDGATSVAIDVEGVALVQAPGLAACDVLSSSVVMSQALLSDDAAGRAFAPLVADMESAALAREACRRGLSFAVARLISDTPAHPLPAFVSPFAAALAAPAVASRLRAAGRGLCAAALDPRAVVRFVEESSAWLRVLEDGWKRLRGAAWC
jgi:hypothetical protein